MRVMKKRTITIIVIFIALLLIFTVWHRFYSPTQWGRCVSDDGCVPRSPEAGYSYVCEEGKCVKKLMGVEEEKRCSIDEDCAAASCCHASEAVNKEFAPDCEGVFCTQGIGVQSCEPGTLDCGQGEIKCVDGRCTVVIY